jgi:hypothetical protein
MSQGGHAACMAVAKIVCNIMTGKAERKRPLGRPRLKWEDNIKMSKGEGEGEGEGVPVLQLSTTPLRRIGGVEA